MQSQEIHDFLYDYFSYNQCDILQKSDKLLSVKLTIELDKELMNRPFYWHYLEKTGGDPNPSILNLVTDWSDEKPDGSIAGFGRREIEKIHFGSNRLHQIFESNRKKATHIRLYENCRNGLFPWLCQNFIISYKSDTLKSTFLSLGLNLINGVIVEEFESKMNKLDLTPKIADLSYTLHPFITLCSGLNRLEKYVTDKLAEEDNSWVQAAQMKMEKEIRLLDNFFKDDKENEVYKKEKQIIDELFTPKIQVDVVNGGLFYLSHSSF